jgi:hypothetical protein
MDPIAVELGQQGWEMVNFTVEPLHTVSTDYKQLAAGVAVAESELRDWVVASYFKRPLAP